jgi:peptide/nickel transport system substrate-binding protein
MRNMLLGAAALLAAAIPATAPIAQPADIRIAVRTDVSSIDPHYHAYIPNRAISRHIFDSLTAASPRGEVKPGLAASWKLVADDVWEFSLRDAAFHDGSKLTAEDVAFTFVRAPDVPNSPSSYRTFMKSIEAVEVIDPRTVRIRTKGPAPTLLVDLESIAILSKAAAEGRATSDFNAGRAAIGTGPYRFIEWQAGSRLVLERNPAYWGGAEPWPRVIFRPIANDGARVAAMLSGDVDMIEGVPGVDRAKLAAAPNLALHETDAFRIIYLQMDSARDASPGLKDNAGNPLTRNPFKDARVRQAISLAINREGLAERLLSGQAKPAAQYVPHYVPGASPTLKPLPFDADRARTLMREAGWPDGFQIGLAGSNDRYPNDAQVAQAIGQMLARIGVKVDVQTMPASQLFSRGSKLEFSAILSGWVGNGEPSSTLVSLMATFDPAKGMGASNRGRWSNAEYDMALQAALRTMDEPKRLALYGRAAEIAIAEMGMIPVYFTINTWATRKDLTYVARGDETSLAMGLRPK